MSDECFSYRLGDGRGRCSLNAQRRLLGQVQVAQGAELPCHLPHCIISEGAQM